MAFGVSGLITGELILIDAKKNDALQPRNSNI
jgi:hypothetical protein